MFLPTNNIHDILAHMKRELQGLYADEEIRSFWFILMEEYCRLSKTRVLTDTDRTISESEMLKVHFAIKDLKRSKPIQYILGRSLFCGMELKVTQDVLIPRPETEELVEWIIAENKEAKNINILDIGTGSGCIALALAKHFPDAVIHAADISEHAIAIAKKNAAKNKLSIQLHSMNVLDESEWTADGIYDLIVSNPPYIRMSEKKSIKDNVLLYEPESALFVPDSEPLKYYEAIFHFANSRLTQNGSLYFEINETLGNETRQLAYEKGFKKVELRKDINGKNRMLRCRKK
jgi:release factor glutamine methyltransferase